MDPKTNKRRGFVFITFKEEEPIKKVLEKKFHNVSGTKDTNGKEGLVSFYFLEWTLEIYYLLSNRQSVNNYINLSCVYSWSHFSLYMVFVGSCLFIHDMMNCDSLMLLLNTVFFPL